MRSWFFGTNEAPILLVALGAATASSWAAIAFVRRSRKREASTTGEHKNVWRDIHFSP